MCNMYQRITLSFHLCILILYVGLDEDCRNGFIETFTKADRQQNEEDYLSHTGQSSKMKESE